MQLYPRALRSDTVRVRPGAYVPQDQWAEATERHRHILRVRAAERLASGRIIFSHESAAAIHGIPVLGDWPVVARASFDGESGMSARAGVRWSRAAWATGDVVVKAGLKVTSARRTALDLARTKPLADGVAALDHVIASGVDRDEIIRWCEASRVHGIGNARRAIRIARGLSESPLESLSLARFSEWGCPPPEQQYEIEVGGHTYRVDFFWPEFGVAGEADGRIKYAASDEVWREKRREDAIRERVRRFLRWSWTDAWTSAPLRARLAAAGIPVT